MAKQNPRSENEAPAEAQDASFEVTVGELEEAVKRLESGELGLDESLKLYEQGINAYRRCQKQLEHAEMRIAKLVQSLEGELQEEPFEPADE